MTPRNFLIRGLVAGLVAGLLTFAVAYAVGEPQVDAAIAVEEAGGAAPAVGSERTHDEGAAAHEHDEAAATGNHHEEGGTVVSRANQSTWGLLTATLGVSIALGGIVGLASAFAVGRFGRLRPEQTTAVVAGIGFVALALVPFLKYPANPPAVGDANTIGDRTAWYFALIAISLVAAAAAVLVGRRVARRGGYRAVLAGIGVYLVAMIMAGEVLPTVNELGNFPADTLWYFRRATLMTLVTMWATIAVVCGALVRQLYVRDEARKLRRELAMNL